MKTTNNILRTERELSIRAVVSGLLIGLLLMAVMMYLDGVLGLDTDIAPIASTIGIFMIPLIGGPTNRKEVNIMQTTATAVAFSAYSLTGNYVPMLMMGEEFRIIPAFIILLLSDAIGICLVTILRDQFVYDESLPFPGAVMCRTALDQVDHVKSGSAKLLLICALISMIISFLQNLEFIPCLFDFSAKLPEGMTLSILVLPLMIGMGYVLGGRISLFMVIASLLVCIIEAPIGNKQGWFVNPAEDFSGIQNFNLSVVIGMSLFAAMIPLLKQRKSFLTAFRFDKNARANSEQAVPLKGIALLLAILEIALIGFCSVYYGLHLVPLIVCNILALLFAVIAVRIFAESGLSAGMALNIFMIFIAFALTKNAMFAMLMAFMNFNTYVLAQDTMIDLKVGQMVQSSPLKQIKVQYIGILCGSLAGVALFYGIVKTFGLESDLFFYPYGRMYFSIAEGLSSNGLAGAFDMGRFIIGAGTGTVFSLIGLPTGAIALALYLAPKTIIGLGLGGFIRFIIEKSKGLETGERLETAATGMVVGDAMACVIMVIATMFIL